METKVDFVARGSSSEQWLMVLVEEGPWHSPVSLELRRVQERLYGCVDVALEGLLAEKFPESCGKDVLIRLDCYNIPRQQMEEFFEKFRSGIFLVEDYASALSSLKYVRSISFELTFDSIH